MEEYRQLVSNKYKTPDGTVLTSNHIHDYVSYTDRNGHTYSLDGGLSYRKIGFSSPNTDGFVFVGCHLDEDFEKVRMHFSWGVINSNRDGHNYVRLALLSNEHIYNIIKDAHGDVWVLELMAKEIQYRCSLEIIISDYNYECGFK